MTNQSSDALNLPHNQQSNTVDDVGAMVNDAVRFHYMDNLRAIAMLMGLFYHAALAYSPLMDNLWLSASSDNSMTMDVVAWFSHLFRMPLFFVISGFFALMMLEKRGSKAFMINRSKRILAPLVVFLPLVMVGIIGGLLWAIGNIDNLSPLLTGIKASQDNPDAPEPPFSTAHLWFLYNLFLFCLTLSLFFRCGLFSAKWIDKIINGKTLILLFPALMVPALYSQSFPHAVADKLIPEAWSFGYYGLLFLMGALIYRKQNLLDEIKPYAMAMFVVSLVAYGYYYAQLPQTMSYDDALAFDSHSAKGMGHLLIVIIESYLGVFLSLLSLLLGRRFLNKHSGKLRYIADSSYWVYIIHLPVLFYLQYLLLDVDWNLWIEFAIGSFGTWAIGLLTYVLLIRSTPIGTLLNGRKWPFLK